MLNLLKALYRYPKVNWLASLVFCAANENITRSHLRKKSGNLAPVKYHQMLLVRLHQNRLGLLLIDSKFDVARVMSLNELLRQDNDIWCCTFLVTFENDHVCHV